MTSDPQVAISFVKAIKNSHIPVEDGSDAIFNKVLLSNIDATGHKIQRETLQSMIEVIDSAISQIDVFHSQMIADYSQEESHSIAKTTLDGLS